MVGTVAHKKSKLAQTEIKNIKSTTTFICVSYLVILDNQCTVCFETVKSTHRNLTIFLNQQLIKL